MKLSINLPTRKRDFITCMTNAAIKSDYQMIFLESADIKRFNNNGNLLSLTDQHMNMRIEPIKGAKWLETNTDTKIFMFWALETIKKIVVTSEIENRSLALVAAAFIKFYYALEVESCSDFESLSAIGNSIKKYNEIAQQILGEEYINSVYKIKFKN